MVRVAVTGAGGRMGERVLRLGADRGSVTLAFAVDRSPGGEIAGVPVHDEATLPDRLAEDGPGIDVLVDFTAPAATARYAGVCAEAGVALVTGTTGLDEAARAALDDAALDVPVLHAPNFSRGVAALRRAVVEAAASLPGADVEITETHHRGKRDAPSGTARTLLSDLLATRDDLTGPVHGREGEAPRESGEVGVHARRAGDVTGEHEILLAGDHEALSLTHRAGDRDVFAAGALDAAAWLSGRDPGRYDFLEVRR